MVACFSTHYRYQLLKAQERPRCARLRQRNPDFPPIRSTRTPSQATHTFQLSFDVLPSRNSSLQMNNMIKYVQLGIPILHSFTCVYMYNKYICTSTILPQRSREFIISTFKFRRRIRPSIVTTISTDSKPSQRSKQINLIYTQRDDTTSTHARSL